MFFHFRRKYFMIFMDSVGRSILLLIKNIHLFFVSIISLLFYIVYIYIYIYVKTFKNNIGGGGEGRAKKRNIT